MKKLFKKKIVLAIPIVILLVAGVGYKFFLAPKPVAPVKKVDGVVVPLSSEFLVNLNDGRYAKVSVALVLDATKVTPAKDGSVALEQEAVIRSIVTDELTGAKSDELINRASRRRILVTLTKAMQTQTDEP